MSKTIPADVFRHLWMNDYTNARDAMAVSNFIFEYLWVTIKNMEIKAHRKLISKYSFRKIRYILIPYFSKPEVWLFSLKLLNRNLCLNMRDNIH